jgi:hypothetical protein
MVQSAGESMTCDAAALLIHDLRWLAPRRASKILGIAHGVLLVAIESFRPSARCSGTGNCLSDRVQPNSNSLGTWVRMPERAIAEVARTAASRTQ